MHDGVGVPVVKSQKFKDILRRRFGIELGEMLVLADDGHQRIPAQPVGLGRLLEQHVIIHVEDARRIFGALHVAGNPE